MTVSSVSSSTFLQHYGSVLGLLTDFLSFLIHFSVHSNSSTMSWFSKAGGAAPVPCRRSLWICPGWACVQVYLWVLPAFHPRTSGIGTISCSLTNSPKIQLSNFISHTTKGFNCLCFHRRCTNVIEWGEDIRAFCFYKTSVFWTYDVACSFKCHCLLG